jgi:hypothetical protein
MRRGIWCGLLCALGFLPPAAMAQGLGAAAPTLDEVLVRVHENFEHYLALLPNLFAEEHLVSSVSAHDGGGVDANFSSTTDSVFRLRRAEDDKTMVRFVEERQILSVNHRPAPPGQTLTGPELVTGAFSYGASFLSPALKRCYDYRLSAGRLPDKAPGLVVEYSLKRSISDGILCPVAEPNSGRAWIDPATMQVVRLEQKRPRHVLEPESYNSLLALNFASVGAGTVAASQVTVTANGAAVAMPTGGPAGMEAGAGALGTWSWSIRYAPVVLNGKSFWLPVTVTSTTSTNSGRLIVWNFRTEYSGYHLLTVTTTIVPESGVVGTR